MRLAFILDPLPTLQEYKDSSIAMMRAPVGRGHEVWAIQRPDLLWREGAVYALATALDIQPGPQWYRLGASTTLALQAFDAVLMRQDPPFDGEYLAATWLLERAEQAGARIINSPRAIRDHNEKLSICEFPHWIPPTLVARQIPVLQDFIEQQGDVVLKPLDGMGGRGIFRVRRDDPNRNVILETITALGQHTIMAQRWLPDIAAGDKRILLIGGQVVPYALARLPKAGEFRGNLAAGGTGIAQPLTAQEHQLAHDLAPILHQRGLFLVGLDVIGGQLTEINVTSPTCFVEISQQTNFPVAEFFVEQLEATLTRA